MQAFTQTYKIANLRGICKLPPNYRNDKNFRFDTETSVFVAWSGDAHKATKPEGSVKLMKKTFVLGVVLSLSSVVFAGQKAYDVIFSAPTKVGSIKLAAGQYTVKVDGSKAVFTNSQTSKSVSTAVKVENGTKKFQYTAVDSTKDGDSEKVNAIELGGSTTKLAFGN